MSTNHISDEELDALFRKAAENQDPPFDPEAWQALDRKLDQVQTKPAWHRRPLLLLLLGLLVLVPIGMYFLPSPKPLNPESQLVVREKGKGGSTEIGIENITDKRMPVPTPPAALVAPEAAANPENEAEKILTNENGIGNELVKEDFKLRDQSEKETLATFDTENEVLDTPAGAAPLPAEPFLFGEIGNHQQQSGEKSEEGNTSLASESRVNEPDQTPGDSTEAPPATTPTDLAEKEGRKDRFMSYLQVSLLLAPDLTTVKFKNPEAVSANAGVLVSFPIKGRLSIQSGLIWANKVYGAAPEDYEPSPGYWDGKNLPTSIDATCKVLDIPLNLQYRILNRAKSTLAVQVGVSSYLMLSEKYAYRYQSGNGYYPYTSTWSVRNQNKHWLRVQNVSLSYSRQLTPAFSVAAAPFVKIPLTGIGAGNVKLTSAGVFLTAGYTIPLSK